METAICPSHNETRGSFATISDGKQSRVGIKPGFYHKAQPGVFYEGGFLGFYVGFINLKVYL